MQQLFLGKRGYLLGFFGCFGLVALALWIQTRYHLEPCPLCITQRICFMVLGAVSYTHLDVYKRQAPISAEHA